MKLVLALGWLSFLSSIEALLGPQTPEETAKAREALMGKGDDEIFEKGESPNAKFARIQNGKDLWPGYPGKGVVPYVLSQDLKSHKELIQKAMNQYHKNTCIRFVPKKKWNKDYIKLVKTDECSSNVGRVNGKQVVNLGEDCLYIGTIVHELGHAIGLDHEHERYDRDEYVTVYWQNIKKSELSNFEKQEPNTVKTPYSYDSVMHYDSYAFSKEPNRLATLRAKNGHKLRAPYRKPGLSKGDIKHINKLYKCNK